MPSISSKAADASDWPPPVAKTVLRTEPNPLPLEVGVVVFEEGIRNPDARDARDKLRSVETRLAAAYLRDILTES